MGLLPQPCVQPGCYRTAGGVADQRRFILSLAILIAAVSATFAALLSAGFVSGGTLLLFMSMISSLVELFASRVNTLHRGLRRARPIHGDVS